MSRTWLPKLWKQITGSTARTQTRCRKPRHTRPGVENLEERAMPSTFWVWNTNDSGAGSLRAAVLAADASPGSTIRLYNRAYGDAFTLTGTIYLTSQLNITSSTTIIGNGASLLAISGMFDHRIFQVNPNVHATLSGLTIENGNVLGQQVGGGILNEGNLTLNGCSFFDDWAYEGGAIYNGGILTVNPGSVLDDNNAATYGGAIYNAATMAVGAPNNVQCFFGANNANVGGGAIFNAGNAWLYNTRISDGPGINHNTAEYGAGIFNDAPFTMLISSCTISDNGATYDGGGIFNEGTVTISGSIVSGNKAGIEGGGIVNQPNSACTVENSSYVESNTSDDGGGICNAGALSLLNYVVIQDNTAYGGGGIDNIGVVWANLVGNTVLQGASQACYIEANHATWRGGGIYNKGTVTLANTIVGTYNMVGGVFVNRGNTAGNDGGGILNDAGAFLAVQNQSAVWFNTAQTGAGIDNLGSLQVINSTFEYNRASWNGGGIANWANATILASTFLGDTAVNDGGGIYTNSSGRVAAGNDTFEYDHANSVGGGFYNTGASVSGVRTLNFVRGTNSAAFFANICDPADSLLF